MQRLLNMLYSGFIVGLGLGTVFQLCLLPLIAGLGLRHQRRRRHPLRG